MSSFTLPTDTDLIAGFQRGDEQALERVFRASYDGLIGDAKPQLDGDVVSANRVVEHLVVGVWKARGSIQSREALQRALVDGLREGVARERSRRAAAHRFAHNERAKKTGGAAAAGKATTLEQAWADVQRGIHASHAGSEHQIAERKKHEAAHHMKDLAARPKWILPTIGGIVAIAGISGAMLWLNKASVDGGVSAALSTADAKIVRAAPGQIGTITLGDGTIAKVAPDANLKIPARFEDVRAVQLLKGAASFTIAPGQEKVFHLRANQVAVTGFSGTFDVMMDSAAPVVVRVREGEVIVRTVGEEGETKLGANQSTVVGLDGAVQTPSTDQLEQAFSWTDGFLVLTSRPLREVIAEIKRWYTTELYVNDQKLMDRPVTIRAPLDSLRIALTAIEKTGGLKMGWEGSHMVFGEGKGVRQAEKK
jgi:ferric-dicitrate binding protein FerR (iron transport regulator)